MQPAAIAAPALELAAAFLAEPGPVIKLPYAARAAAKLRTGLPAILAGLRVAVVLALVGVVVAEFMGASRGLGAVVIAAQGMMDTTLMFAALVLVAGIGLLLYQGCLLLEHRLLRAHAFFPDHA